MTRNEPPMLDCPKCSKPLIPATGRGRFDSDGEYLEHRDACRCPRCDWMWFEESDPVDCECGARVRVVVDDERAYASEVSR